jgi:hypothetical protein
MRMTEIDSRIMNRLKEYLEWTNQTVSKRVKYSTGTNRSIFCDCSTGETTHYDLMVVDYDAKAVNNGTIKHYYICSVCGGVDEETHSDTEEYEILKKKVVKLMEEIHALGYSAGSADMIEADNR